MARSPFQGTWQAGVRPTVVTAPDALVYINGETNLIGCPSCKRKFDLHKYITSIQVDLNVDSAPGSANISMVVPRHAIDDFYFEGVPVISPMMEIEIYAKGHFLLEGVPQYYPIFWGIVTEVTDQYSGGQHTVSINCNDILKWWELCRMNINPAFTAPKGQQGWNLFGNVFNGMNPYDIIWSLSQEAMGDVVIGTGSLTSLNGEAAQKQTFSTALSDIMLYWQSRFSKIRSNLLLYGVQGVAVRGDTLYAESRTERNKSREPFASTAVRKANGGPLGGGMVFDVTGSNVTAFKTQFNNAGQVNFWQSEYQTKLEIANACKDSIGFEFYMDVTGDIVFKPPFYNLDTLPNKPVSWIQDIDIIDWDFSESEAEVVTHIQMAGSYGGNIDYGFPQDVEPFTSVTDYHLLRKYGWRTHQVNSEFLGNPQLMFYHGLDILDRLNSRRHRGTVSIPIRPELRLGFPVYVAPKDQMWYVSGISHNIQFGGQAQTTLTLTARRGKFFAPRGIGSLTLTALNGQGVPTNAAATKEKAAPKGTVRYGKTGATVYNRFTARQLAAGGKFNLVVGSAAQVPAPDISVFSKPANENPYAPMIFRHPKTGRACGFPNVVMAYTRPFVTAEAVGDADTKLNQGGTTGPKTNAGSKVSSQVLETRYNEWKTKAEKVLTANQDGKYVKYIQNRYSYGLNTAGVFTYCHDKGGLGADFCITELTLLPSSSIQSSLQKSKEAEEFEKKFKKGASGVIRPVSDERGFEVIGHFRYGRGISLRDGVLTLSSPQGGGLNQTTNISLQTALSGDLSAALMAQSQGLTTVVTAYPNPAANLATLLPEELQTGAVIEPGQPDKPKFSNADPPFIQNAPLGSPEAADLPPSLEVSQLSRALTLAEMSVKYQDGSEEGCECILGRPDLTFITQGLKIETIRSTGPATSTLVGSDPTQINTSQPVDPAQAFPVGSPEEVASKVNNFLYQLYGALDSSHHEFEQVLRGDINRTQRTQAGQAPTGVNDGLGGSTSFSPPFNPSERYMVGDLDSVVAMVESNATQLENTWQKFASDYKTKPVLVAYQQRLAQLQTQIAQIDAQINKLKQQLAELDPNNPFAKQLQKQIEELEKRREKLVKQAGDIQQRVDAILNGDGVTKADWEAIGGFLDDAAQDISDAASGGFEWQLWKSVFSSLQVSSDEFFDTLNEVPGAGGTAEKLKAQFKKLVEDAKKKGA